jgi:hypothetical protein
MSAEPSNLAVPKVTIQSLDFPESWGEHFIVCLSSPKDNQRDKMVVDTGPGVEGREMDSIEERTAGEIML